MQSISYDNTVRSNTVQDLKDFISNSSSTQAETGEQLVSMMPAIKTAFDLMGDDIVELSRENEPLKKYIGFYDGKWLKESKGETLKQINDEKKQF